MVTNSSSTTEDRSRPRTVLIFAGASLAAVAVGAAIMASTGVPLDVWIRNPMAWLVGLVFATGVMFLRSSVALSRVILGFAFVAVAGTFFAGAQEGVHRWIVLGPLQVNIAALLLPAAVVALAWCRIWSRTALAFVAGTAALLLLQPDASQATSFLFAVIILFADSPASRVRRFSAIAAAVVVAVISWSRPDPLRPVPEVEGIFALAFGVSPILAAAAALALAGASFAPLALRTASGTPHRMAAIALSGYFVSAAVCPAFGAFPVPLVGLGMSFPVGYWLAIALLCAKGRPFQGQDIDRRD